MRYTGSLVPFLLWSFFCTPLTGQGIELADQIKKNVVKISGEFANGDMIQGFGFISGERGEELYILTAAHVVTSQDDWYNSKKSDPTSLRVTFYTESEDFEAVIIPSKIDFINDLAVLRTQKPTYLEWKENCIGRSAEIHQKIRFIGRDGDWNIFSDGEIVDITPDGKIKFTSPSVRVGTSGAPLLNDEGIIGLITDDDDNVAIALRIEKIRELVIEKGRFRHMFTFSNNGEQTLSTPPVDAPEIIADFSITKSNDCEAPCIVQFNNLSKNANSYQWYFGDGDASKEISPNHQYRQAGTYSIRLVASDGTMTKEISKTLKIAEGPSPIASFRAYPVKCSSPCEVTITNNSQNASSFNWNFGDGTSSYQENPERHTYRNPGRYTIDLTARNGDKEDHQEIEIVVEEEKWVIDPSGNRYETIRVDGKTWLQSNLNYETGTTWCVDNNPANCSFYGRLYNWNAAKAACQSLGSGWRLPSASEWKAALKTFSNATSFISQMQIRMGGSRFGNGTYSGKDLAAPHWISDEGGFITFDKNGIKHDTQFWNPNYNGFLCRCVKD